GCGNSRVRRFYGQVLPSATATGQVLPSPSTGAGQVLPSPCTGAGQVFPATATVGVSTPVTTEQAVTPAAQTSAPEASAKIDWEIFLLISCFVISLPLSRRFFFFPFSCHLQLCAPAGSETRTSGCSMLQPGFTF